MAEDVASDVGDGWRDLDVGQRGAVGEGVAGDVLEMSGKGDGGESGIPGAEIAREGFHAVGD